MLACSAMVACTNTDEPEVDNGGANGKKYYAAVNLAMPGNTSRAAAFDGYADGTPAENTVNNVTFFFLDANGNSCANAFYLGAGLTSSNYAEDDNTTGEGDDAVTTLGRFDEKTSTIIVMENPTEIPSSIVAVINMGDITKPNSNFSSTALLSSRPTLDQINAVVGNYATTTWNAMPTTGMVMSNTAYKNANGEIVIGAPVSAENIITEKGDPYNPGQSYTGNVPPVTIYVEKVLAKVQVNGVDVAETASNQNKTTISLIDKTNTNDVVGTSAANATLFVDITGWWLDSAPQQSLLLKDINNVSYSWDWNDMAFYRSYWANSYAGDGQAYTNYKYSTGAANNNALYCQENTSQPTRVNTQAEDDATTGADNTYDVNNRTKVVVAATLKKNSTDTEGVDLVKWYGKYYTKEAFLITFANLNDVKKYYTRTGEGTEASPYVYTSLSSASLMLDWNKDQQNVIEGDINGDDDYQANVSVNGTPIRNYEAVVVLKNDVTVYTLSVVDGETVGTPANATTVNEELKSISKVQYWNGGKTYYYVELEHQTNHFGVVRNHLYNVNLTAISGLGTPVPNTEKIIIPEKPGDSDMNTYISANIIIMSYRIVNQNVTLQ